MKHYKEFFEDYLWDLSAILQAWSETPARLLPDSVGRGRRRKNETQEEWKQRSLGLLQANPPKRPATFDKNFGHIQRTPGTLRNVSDVFDLNPEEVERYGFLLIRDDAVRKFETDTERRQRQELRTQADGLEELRTLMHIWVGLTLETKRSEASCNLDCTTCGSAMLLLCAAQNLSPIHHDSTLTEDDEHVEVEYRQDLVLCGVTSTHIRELLNEG